jgi:hypothetical protein
VYIPFVGLASADGITECFLAPGHQEPRLKRTLLRSWPLYISILALLLIVWLLLNISLSQNQGYLVYSLDDPYIHMAMARNLSQSGVWGVTRYGFTSTSSSPLWTLLLSLTYYLLGVGQAAPLLWNLVFAILVLLVAYAILSSYRVSPLVKFVALMAMVLLVPLPMLVLSGMEQILQTLLSMLILPVAARVISCEFPASVRRDSVWLLILAPLVTSVRFEGMFLIIAICGLLLILKRWTYALAVGVAGFFPPILNGVISVSRGWFWFPTTLLLKASLPDFSSVSHLLLSVNNAFYMNLRFGLHVFALLVGVILFYALASNKGSDPRESRQVMGTLVVLTVLAHLEFVGNGSLYRYDAYLCPLGILYLALQVPVVAPGGLFPAFTSARVVARNLAWSALAMLLLFPLAEKGARLLWFAPQCTSNIFEQQYQMGLFVRRYYQGLTVALNDIGAVNFLADIHCLDLWGLANREIAAAKQKHTYQMSDIARLSKQSGTRIAIIYDDWFTGAIPPEWVRVGQWTIQHNIIAGGETVSFYAVDPAETAHLTECLRDYSPHLPGDVIQRGPYLSWGDETGKP